MRKSHILLAFFVDQKQALLVFYLSVDPKLNLPQINIHKSLLNVTVMSPAGLTSSPLSHISLVVWLLKHTNPPESAVSHSVCVCVCFLSDPRTAGIIARLRLSAVH